MSILQEIKIDQMESRKQRDTIRANLLTTLYSEAAMVGFNDGRRESTDTEVLATIKKFIKNLTESLQAVKGSETIESVMNREMEILVSYLPIQLTESQLTDIISNIVTAMESPSAKDMGKVMTLLKQQHDGQFDGKVASQLVKNILVSK